MSSPKLTITHLSDLTPPSQERTWLTSPHPTLPIVATCSSDKTIRIYSLTNFTLVSTITGGHKRSVRTAAWKPHMTGESVLATGSFDATVGIWRRWDSYGREDGTSWGMAETQENTTPTPTPNDTDREEDEEEWRFAVLLDGHDSEVKSVSWSASGMLLATCSRDKSIWIWEDLDDGDNNFETVAVMQEHSGDVKCVSWHPTEECLASGSYDDTIRIWREDLDDWGQVACLKGHEGTVWYIDWEGQDSVPRGIISPGVESESESESDLSALQAQWRTQMSLSGPRLLSCSDDRTVRVWRRQPKESHQQAALSSASTGIPSIIRPMGTDEIWEEYATLPRAHELPVYAVAWSKRSGLVASTGADGRIAIYEERFVLQGQGQEQQQQQQQLNDPDAMDTTSGDGVTTPLRTEWVLVGVHDGAHGIYEINHVAWTKRADRGSGAEEEEVLITTADDGSVKVWTVR